MVLLLLQDPTGSSDTGKDLKLLQAHGRVRLALLYEDPIQNAIAVEENGSAASSR